MDRQATDGALTADSPGEPAAAPAESPPQAAPRTSGGRRYSSGRRPPERVMADPLSRPAGRWPGAEASPFPAGYPARGTLAGFAILCLVSCLIAAWLHRDVVAGLGFCAGGGLAARYTRPAALLRVVIFVPVVFLTAEVAAQLLTSQGERHGLTGPVLDGTMLTLTWVAPWLFAGTAGTVTIALFRGLPRCIRDLRDELRGGARSRPR